jgi:hypothetical protein
VVRIEELGAVSLLDVDEVGRKDLNLRWTSQSERQSSISQNIRTSAYALNLLEAEKVHLYIGLISFRVLILHHSHWCTQGL